MELSQSRAVQNIIGRLFSGTKSSFAIRFWDGSSIRFGDQPQFILAFNDKHAFKRILISPNALTAGEAFIRKQIDLEGDIFSAIKLKGNFENSSLTLRDKLAILLNLLRL